MKILIIGSGGREHALAWKAAQSTQVNKVYVAPGNAGTAQENKVENVSIQNDDFDALIAFALEQQIALTIVGPEIPLAMGITEAFNKVGLKCFGPSAKATRLESSKNFAKEFMTRHKIATAAFASFTEAKAAKDYIQQQSFPLVIKADGLAAGKGVIIAESIEIAYATIDAMLVENRFGNAGNRIIVEEFLQGEEASFIVITDGENVIPLASSQDHKKRDDGDQGPNTGGMGVYSPSPLITPATEQRILKEIIYPSLQGLKQEGTPYVGFLYAGLMFTPKGDIKVLEFNCRLGDPETQVIMLRMRSDLVQLCLAALNHQLATSSILWDKRSALGVVLAAAGYPEDYKKGDVIFGLDTINAPDIKVFHSGTKFTTAKEVCVNGGRVLCVCALGDTIQQAQQHAYHNVDKISWQTMQYRRDIGYRAINKVK